MQKIAMIDRLTSPACTFKSAFHGHGYREGGGDAARRDGRERGQSHGPAANDNGGPEARIDDAVMRLARLLGRQIAREQFEATRAA